MICSVHSVSSNIAFLTNYLFRPPSPMPLILPVFPISLVEAQPLYMSMLPKFVEHENPHPPLPHDVFKCVCKSGSLPPPAPSRSLHRNAFVISISGARVRLTICCRLRLPSVRRPCTLGPARCRWGSRLPPSTTQGDPPGTARASRLKQYRRIYCTTTWFWGQLGFLRHDLHLSIYFRYIFDGDSSSLSKNLETLFCGKGETLPYS